jgi:mRNA interferase RelE/StbE
MISQCSITCKYEGSSRKIRPSTEKSGLAIDPRKFEGRLSSAVADKDIPSHSTNLHIRIAGAIASRLTRSPHQYGTPLRKTLRGYWKLRVGDYRVVYKIEGEEAWGLGVQHRKTVYEDIVQRLDKPR